MATEGTALMIENENIPVETVGKIGSSGRNLLEVIRKGEVQFVVNTLTKGKQPARDGFRIRRECAEGGVVCLTNLDTAVALLEVLESISFSAHALSSFTKNEKVFI
jgi:carbamoyl-phosphate synthase large subunit